MKITAKIILLITFFMLLNNMANAKTANAIVHLPPGIDLTRLSVSFDDGLKTEQLHPQIENNSFTVSREYFSRYGTLSLAYPDLAGHDSIPEYSFWLTDQQAVLSFYKSQNKLENPLRCFTLENAIAIDYAGEAEHSAFIQTEVYDMQCYYVKNKDSINRSFNSICAQAFKEKLKKADLKSLEYIRSNADCYYALFLFGHRFAPSHRVPAMSLLNFYNTVFPDSLRNTFEGKVIYQQLIGRINTREGHEAPDFTLKDSKGNVVTLSKLKGKYVLIDFWASWCKPCKRLYPDIRALRNKYSESQLEILSISLDEEAKEFYNALKIEQPNWTQLLSDSRLKYGYSVSAIPYLLLIDPTGMVIFNSEEEKDPSVNKVDWILNQQYATTNN